MKKYDIHIEGKWTFCYGHEGNSKEEAIKKALQAVKREAGPIEIEILEQYVHDENKPNVHHEDELDFGMI